MDVSKSYTRGFVGGDQNLAESAGFREVYAMRDDAAIERDALRDAAVVPHRGVAHAPFDHAVRADRRARDRAADDRRLIDDRIAVDARVRRELDGAANGQLANFGTGGDQSLRRADVEPQAVVDDARDRLPSEQRLVHRLDDPEELLLGQIPKHTR